MVKIQLYFTEIILIQITKLRKNYMASQCWQCIAAIAVFWQTVSIGINTFFYFCIGIPFFFFKKLFGETNSESSIVIIPC